MHHVIIYTDGSCLGNPGNGGWAAILTLEGSDTRKEISGGFAMTTNNRMEITGRPRSPRPAYRALPGFDLLGFAVRLQRHLQGLAEGMGEK